MEGLIETRRVGAARDRLNAFVASLREQLDAEPSPTLVRLAHRIDEAESIAHERPAGSGALLSPPMVGRDAALAALRAAWADVADGGAAAVAVLGGTGLGKTLLCEQFLRSVRDAGAPALVLRARGGGGVADELEVARALLAGLATAPGLGGAADDDLGRLTGLVPAIRARWPNLPSPSHDERALHAATADVLAAVAAEQPVAAFVDDVVLADPASRRLLVALAHLVPDGVLLVLAMRSDAADGEALVSELRAAPRLRQLRLRPLEPADVEELLAAMVLLPAADRKALAERLHAETGGNPLFVVEIVAALAEIGGLAPDGGAMWRLEPAVRAAPLPVPRSVRGAVAHRFDELPGPARTVARAVAAADSPVTVGRLVAATGLSSERVHAAVEHLVARRVLRQARASPDAVEFSSGLIRRAAAEGWGASPPPRGTARPRPPRIRRLVAAAVAVVALIVTATLVVRGGASAPPPVLAVGLLEQHPADDTVRLALPVSDMLATNLARVPGLQVVSHARLYEVLGQLDASSAAVPSLADAARRAGADALLEGALHRTPSGALRLDLRRVDLRTGRVRDAYTVEGADAFELADRATAALAEAHGLSAGPLRVADVTTRSLTAYRFYEEGLRSMGEADYRTAHRLFTAALAEDSLFAMAALQARTAANALGDATPSPSLGRLDSLAARASDRERLLIRAAVASSLHEPRFAAYAETLAVRYPTEPAGQLMLAVARIEAGEFMDAVPYLRRVIAMDSLGLFGEHAQCRACSAYASMTQVYLHVDSGEAALRTLREWLRRQPESPLALELLAGALFTLGRFAEAEQAHRRAWAARPGHPTDALYPEVLRIAAGRYEEADSALQGHIASGTPEVRHEALWLLTISLRDQGRLEDALHTAVRLERLTADRVHGVRAPPIMHRAQVQLEMGRFREAARAFDSLAASPPPHLAGGQLARFHSWMNTHIATSRAAAGDTAGLKRTMEPLRTWGPRSAYGRDRRLLHHAEGLLYLARGRPEEAIAAFRRAIYSPTHGYTRTNYELARLLLAQGRPAEAVAVLEPALHGSLDASNLYITRTELRALLAEALEAAGQRERAVALYRSVLQSWKDADPSYHARRDALRRRVAALDE